MGDHRPEETVTLRIKKIYFDRILSGEKKYEYRDAKPFYDRLFSKPVKWLALHYQGDEMLFVRVREIVKIPTPEKLKESNIPFGPEVYRIALGKVRRL